MDSEEDRKEVAPFKEALWIRGISIGGNHPDWDVISQEDHERKDAPQWAKS